VERNAEGEVRLPLSEHLEELRRRLIRSLVALAAGTALCYRFAQPLFEALAAPLARALPPGSRFVFTELTEAFLTYFKVALWGGFVLSSPVIFHQMWRFVEPGLYRKEKALVGRFALWSAAGFLGGIAFGYFVALPAIFSFLLSFGRSLVLPMPSMKETLSFVLRMLLLFGVMFELPLVMFLGGRAGLFTPALFRRGRKLAVPAVLLVGAVLTPPDVVSQLVVAIPLYLLYEVGIVACAAGARRAGRRT